MRRHRFPGPAAALYPAALLLALTATSSNAQVGREQSAHAHGTTAVTLALVGGAFELELTAPGMDLVGFEHAPGNPEQEQAIAETTAALERSSDWLAFEPAGTCTVVGADAHTHGFAAGSGQDGSHGHEHAEHGTAPAAAPGQSHNDAKHDHEHDHDHEGGHGEFHLQLTATCAATPEALTIDLASRFPGIERIRIDLITDTRQDRVELGTGQTRVPLSR